MAKMYKFLASAAIAAILIGCRGNADRSSVRPTNTPNTPYVVLKINRFTDDPAINYSSQIFSDGRIEHRYTENNVAYDCTGSLPAEEIDKMRENLRAINEDQLGIDSSFWTDFEELDSNGRIIDSLRYSGGLEETSAPETARQLVNTANSLGPYPGNKSSHAPNCREAHFERF